MSSDELADDNRLTLDVALKAEVLAPLASRTGCDMKDLAFMCIAFAIELQLTPLQPEKKDPNNWHANENESIYRLIALNFNTNTPIRMASELANAGMLRIRSRVQSDADLLDVFKLGEVA